MTRFFVRPDQIAGSLVNLDADDAHHLRVVLHAQPGQKIAVLDNSGREWPATLLEMGRQRRWRGWANRCCPKHEPPVKITVAQALPKVAEKMEQVLQRGTEIGASGFWAFQSERSLTHLTGELHEKRRGRWESIIKTAAEQSHRAVLPTLRVDGGFADVLAAAGHFDLALLAYEGEREITLAQALTAAPETPTSILILIGPESGLTDSEIKAARKANVQTVSLGPRILRTETAAMVMVSQILFGAGASTLFVDIHNHILPSVDDGARSVAEALEMARQAVSVGTDTMVATPHRGWFLGRPAHPEAVREHVAGLQESLNRAHIPLRVVPGVEIKMAPRVADDLVSGEAGTLGDAGRWALIEPPFDRIPPGGLDSLRKVTEAGFQIILAHPERCAEVQQGLAFLDACAALGMAFQITSGSLLGRFGPRAQSAAHAILARAADWPLVIASDTHDLHERSCGLLREARDAAAALVGAERAQEMVDARPRGMISPV